MRNLIRIVKHVGVVALLALFVSGAALTGDSAAVASASTITRESYICLLCVSSSPTISAQYTSQFGGTEGHIAGNSFTPGGTVRVRVRLVGTMENGMSGLGSVQTTWILT